MHIFKSRSAKDNIIIVSLFFIFLLLCIGKNRNNLHGVIWSDVEGYYLYLPALFIQNTFHHVSPRSMGINRNDKGEVVIKYTCGVALFELPFFLGAHMYATVFHYDTSGYSPPYSYGLLICGVFWAFVGLYLLKKLLSEYFSWHTTWLTLLCILLGTNFFYYTIRYIGMSHIFSFVLVTSILLVTRSYYENPTKGKAMIFGLFFGWLVLTRPTNCVVFLVILLFNVVTLYDLKQRIAFLKSRFSDVIPAIPFFVLPLIPQMLYWKEMYGKWITYTYEGEKFLYWKNPKIFEVLFDTQNGLLLYSPILLFMFLGFFIARKDQRTNFIGISIVFVIITYTFASWWAWWFGGAYGHRCYIEYFPVFALPIAVVMEKIFSSKKKYIKISATLVIILFMYYNVGMSMLFNPADMWDGPEWRWNWDIWFSKVKQLF